ncbi:hypothetical protein BDW42DRAFT_166650 [Aspergillus taichungensis]|uniref:Transmembrane protein n=1 Tax=Aspergillus taichungensis TaxID=482145 RepID=A0A2J5HYQ8_9EURO|nr:hypothetical protein BDW42DRAFT_166650 [Aspergillus taichungensis]
MRCVDRYWMWVVGKGRMSFRVMAMLGIYFLAKLVSRVGFELTRRCDRVGEYGCLSFTILFPIILLFQFIYHLSLFLLSFSYCFFYFLISFILCLFH